MVCATDPAVREAASRRAVALRGAGGDAHRPTPGHVPAGQARMVPFAAQEMRAQLVRRDGKDFYRLDGVASVFGREYEMWDVYGPYVEEVAPGASDETLAAHPDVAYLVNHMGLTMARTTNGTLILKAAPDSLPVEAYLNPGRPDVQMLVSAVEDRLVTEMSFAFMITRGGWNDDFTKFTIEAFDLDRGDVSAVNYGSNPYTSIAARARTIVNELDHLPAGAARAALDRLHRRTDLSTAAVPNRQGRAKSVHVRRLVARVDRTAARFVDHAARNQVAVADLPSVRLPWYTIKDQADGTGGEPDVATVFLFDEIGGSFGVDATQFVKDLEAITAPTIKVRINSPGGSVFDAIAIYNALNHHPSHVVVYVDSLAASAASVVAVGGDEVVMMPGAQMMIHDASAVEDGNAADMAKMATFLGRQSDNVADIYRRKGGGDAADWRELMLAETWMFADEAVIVGLADRVEDPHLESAREPLLTRSFDLSHFRYAGRRDAPAPRSGRPRPEVPAQQAPTTRSTTEPIDPPPPMPDEPGGRTLAQVEAELSIDLDD